MSHPILTNEQIDALNRGDLQDALRARDLSSSGSTVVLNARLKDWVADQQPTAPAAKSAKMREASEAPAPSVEPAPDAETPPASSAPDTGTVGPEIDPPASEVEPEATVVAVDATGIGARVTTYLSNPEEEESPEVPVLEGDQPAESYRELCQTNTVVRVHDAHIVQVLDQPFDRTGKHCAYQQLGLRVRSFVNEELAAIDNRPSEETVLDEDAPAE